MSEASSIDPRQGAAVIPDAAVWRGSRRPFCGSAPSIR